MIRISHFFIPSFFHSFVLAVLAAAATLTASAQRIAADKQSIDCGRSGFEMPVTATFEMRNKGIKILHIEDVRPDCGCTTVDFPHKGIMPGEKFKISVTYDGRMLGHYQKQVAVYSNAGKKPFYLTMRGHVLADYQDYSQTLPYEFGEILADQNTVEFDDVNKGECPKQVITIVNNGTTAMQPNLMHLPKYLTAECLPEKVQPGQLAKLMVTLDSRHIRDFGLTQTSVYMASQLGDKVAPDIELPVSVVLLPSVKQFEGNNQELAPRMEISDTIVTLGVVNGKLQKSQTISIANTGRTKLEISSLQMFTRGLRLTLGKRELLPGEHTKLKIAVSDQKALDKSRTKPRVLMITNDPQRSKLIIGINK